MRHQRRKAKLGLKTEHRQALLRNLARGVIFHQRIITTHLRAKEASRFIDRLITTAKDKSLHARRQLISKLGSGSEALAKKLIEVIAPKFADRHGGYTRVLRYKDRAGDGATLALLEFSIPVETIVKKPRKKKEVKPAQKEKAKEEPQKKDALPAKKETADKEKTEEIQSAKEEAKKETQKKGGFLGTLRRFLKGDDDRKK